VGEVTGLTIEAVESLMLAGAADLSSAATYTAHPYLDPMRRATPIAEHSDASVCATSGKAGVGSGVHEGRTRPG
jgi:hypothetical protein